MGACLELSTLDGGRSRRDGDRGGNCHWLQQGPVLSSAKKSPQAHVLSGWNRASSSASPSLVKVNSLRMAGPSAACCANWRLCRARLSSQRRNQNHTGLEMIGGAISAPIAAQLQDLASTTTRFIGGELSLV